METTLDKYEKIQLYGGNLDKKAKRVWKKFEGEPEDIRELEDRITLNVKLLNTFIGHISAYVSTSFLNQIPKVKLEKSSSL